MVTAVHVHTCTVRRVALFQSRRAEHIMGMPATHAHWTVEMLDALQEDAQRYEIIDGELFVTPAPSEVHQLVAGALFSVVRAYLTTSAVARAMISPADVRRGDRTRIASSQTFSPFDCATANVPRIRMS